VYLHFYVIDRTWRSRYSPAFRILGDTFIGAIRSTGLGLITRSVTFYSPIETPRTIGKPISPKSRDILPAALESILRHARQTHVLSTRSFGNTDVDRTRFRRGWKKVAPAFRRDPRPHFHEFGITRGDVTGIHAAHGAPRHSRARVYEHVEQPAATGWKRVQSPF